MNGTDRPTAASVENIGLVGALILLIVYGAGGSYEQPEPAHFAALLAGFVGIGAILTQRRWAGAFTLLAVLLTALRERAIQGDHRSSDVMLVTNEAVSTLLSGQNPYAHFYQLSNPPGAVFGYPPGEIIFYTLPHLFGANVFRIDLACSILALGLIAALSPFCGTGLAALAVAAFGWHPDVLYHITDGSNDHAAAFLVVAGFAALIWSNGLRGRPGRMLWWISAIAFGWSLAFKEYTAPVVLFLALYLWRIDHTRARAWIAAVIATCAAFIVPFFLWNPAALFANVGGALITHHNIWGRNVWHDWLALTPLGDAIAPVVPVITLVAILAVTIAFWRMPAVNAGFAFMQGLLVLTTALILARWTTSTYYWFLIPTMAAAGVLAVGQSVVPEMSADES